MREKYAALALESNAAKEKRFLSLAALEAKVAGNEVERRARRKAREERALARAELHEEARSTSTDPSHHGHRATYTFWSDNKRRPNAAESAAEIARHKTTHADLMFKLRAEAAADAAEEDADRLDAQREQAQIQAMKKPSAFKKEAQKPSPRKRSASISQHEALGHFKAPPQILSLNSPGDSFESFAGAIVVEKGEEVKAKAGTERGE